MKHLRNGLLDYLLLDENTMMIFVTRYFLFELLVGLLRKKY